MFLVELKIFLCYEKYPQTCDELGRSYEQRQHDEKIYAQQTFVLLQIRVSHYFYNQYWDRLSNRLIVWVAANKLLAHTQGAPEHSNIDIVTQCCTTTNNLDWKVKIFQIYHASRDSGDWTVYSSMYNVSFKYCSAHNMKLSSSPHTGCKCNKLTNYCHSLRKELECGLKIFHFLK